MRGVIVVDASAELPGSARLRARAADHPRSQIGPRPRHGMWCL